jgi:cytochrome oxidase assembly protein ShyY1
MSDLREALQRPLDPRIILLDADQPDGLVREWRPSTIPPERHLGYAVTWFALAAALAVIYLVMNLRKDPDNS